MDIGIIDHLSCPYCANALSVSQALNRDEHEISWGTLSCKECETHFPVVEGIPIIMPPDKRIDVFDHTKKYEIHKRGITVGETCKLIQAGDIEHVRKAVVYSIQYQPDIVPNYVEKIIGKLGKRVAHKILYVLYVKHRLEKELTRVLESNKTTAREVIDVYYQDNELRNYFFYKFGQPRFLVSLGLASVFSPSDKLILDLACGQGHLVHFLSQEYENCTTIGVDRNFVQLFIAKRYIAPKGHYICVEADEKLPFKKGVFSNIICSDAFHYLQNKSSCIRDLKKLVDPYGLIILSRVGNRLVAPNEGTELTPPGYIKLFGTMEVRMVGDDDVLNNYLQKQKPDLPQINDIPELNEKKWLSMVASGNDRVFRDTGSFDTWPHARGDLDLNPLYQKIGMDDKHTERYRFSYPSDWYKFEDFQWMTYAPAEVSIATDIKNRLKNNNKSVEVNKLIDNFVVMGFPQKYM